MKKYYLENMPQVNESMERVELWYQGEKTDRAPIRFSEHNARHNVDLSQVLAGYETIKDFWFDTEYQVDSFIENLKGSTVYGDTFPVFYPNLGPSVYASYYGVPLSYADVTSWAIHTVSDIDALDIDSLKIDRECENWKKIDELTDYALARCKDKFFVGYTDLHPSMDCAVDFTGVNEMCMSLIDNPDKVKEFLNKLCDDFFPVYDYYYNRLEGMPSVSWMGIPFEGKMHIPSCDFSSMLSPAMFEEFVLPCVVKEAKAFDHNIFHMDGPGVMRHLDMLLDVNEIRAIQLVQGVGEDEPIMQWLPVIKKIQARGKGIVVGLQKHELKDFMANMDPKGIFLTLAADEEEQPEIVKLVEQWCK